MGTTEREPTTPEPGPDPADRTDPGPDPANPELTGPHGSIQGTDKAALGTALDSQGAPPGARVSDVERLVPGANLERPHTDAKPWSTSLAAGTEQAGVANDPPDAQPENFPPGDDAGRGLPPEDDVR